jgi:glucose/arabinose dehydrogenase
MPALTRNHRRTSHPRGRRALALGAIAVVAASVVAGCAADTREPIPTRATSTPTPTPSATATATPTPGLEGQWRPDGSLETLASDLVAPWSVVPLADGDALISQRDDGRVLERTTDGAVREVGVVPGVAAGGEGGLLGLAVLDDGDGAWLYAYFTAADDNRVVRMPLDGDTGSYTLGEPEVVFAGIAKAGNHNGGRIAFGPDGFLYIATGDASDTARSQDLASPNGKILRVTPEGDPAPGNPFDSAVYSLGHRNVQGMAWTSDGRMWASEFGQNTFDELNLIEPGSNYGWPMHEGVADADGFVDPVATWSTADASPSGIAAVGDTVFMAGLRGERVWMIDTQDGAAAPEAFLVGEQGRIRDVVLAIDGSLWLLTNNTDGRGSPRPGDDLLLRAGIETAG